MMSRYPVVLDQKTTGTMEIVRDGLYDVYTLSCQLRNPEVLRAIAVGEKAEIRLGIPVPDGPNFRLCRRVPERETKVAGKILRCELRRQEEPSEEWERVQHPEQLFHNSFLQEQLRGIQDIRSRRKEDIRYLALPYNSRRPFLLTAMFCFARMKRIDGALYAVFAFDRDESPVFR